jgi:putative oxidoreductase
MLRVVVGGLFAGHGAQKLFGSFGGKGLEATGQGFEQVGLRPGKQMATLAGASELAGGTLVALGAATPLGAAMLSGVMASAIERVHLKNGPWNADGGYEYPLVLMALLFQLTDAGAGPISIDRLRKNRHSGPGWAVAQLAVGVGGAAAVRAFVARRESLDAGGEPSSHSARTGLAAVDGLIVDAHSGPDHTVSRHENSHTGNGTHSGNGRPAGATEHVPSTQSGSDHSASDHSGSAKSGSDQSGTAKSGSDHAGSAKSASDHAGSDHSGSAKSASDHAGSDHSGSAKSASDHAGSAETKEATSRKV